jgi:hypothetical protein
MRVKTSHSNIVLSLTIAFYKVSDGFLLFSDNDGGEIMHLPINGGEIGKNPFIDHAHSFHQGGLIEQVQIRGFWGTGF